MPDTKPTVERKLPVLRSPHGLMHQAFALVVGVTGVWLFFSITVRFVPPDKQLYFARIILATGAFIPWTIKWVSICAENKNARWRQFFKMKIWGISTLLLAGASLTNLVFGSNHISGFLHPVYVLGLLFAYATLAIEGIRKARGKPKNAAIEVELLISGAAASGVIFISLTMLPSILGQNFRYPQIAILAPLIVLSFIIQRAWEGKMLKPYAQAKKTPNPRDMVLPTISVMVPKKPKAKPDEAGK